MSTTTFNVTSISTLLICFAAVASGCHNHIGVVSTSSATDENDYFGTTTGTASDTEAVPTTSAGGGDLDPTQYCQIHPSEDFPGFVHVCSGEVHGNVVFDYHGDPDLPLEKYVPCIDFTQPPYNSEKPAGYLYTCFAYLSSYPFGPDIEQPNGHQVDACCLRDSPFEATADFCRIDAAEEFCHGASDGLNALRAEIPHLPSLSSLHNQLEGLNKFIASSSTQTNCSKQLAKEFVDRDNFNDKLDPVSWGVEHPLAEDPEVGWPWLRNISLNVFRLEIDSSELDGLSCHQVEGDAVTGDIQEGTLAMSSHLGDAQVHVVGEASFHRSACRLDTCEFQLETLDLQIDDFEVDSLSFTDVSVSLAAPTTGLINNGVIGMSESQMHLTATFRLTAEGEPQFGGEPVSVVLRNSGVAEMLLLPDSTLAVQRLDVSSWPFKMHLVSEVSP